MTADTPFPLASITKNFVATAAGILVEEGKLDWDDPVQKHLPAIQFPDDYRTRHTTLRDLLCHRTGLERADLLAARGDLTNSQIVARIRYLKPLSGFREKFGYHNLMYYVAGELVSQAGGSPWDEFVAQRLLKPLGMDSTVITNKIEPNKRAVLHRWQNGKLVAGQRQSVDVSPAGGLQSTANDMAKWTLTSLAKDDQVALLPEKTRRHMRAIHTSIPVDYVLKNNRYAARFFGRGLGWATHEYQGRALSYHTGSTGAVFATLPEEDFGVVVLTNVDFSDFAIMLMYDILDAWFVGKPKMWGTDEWEFFRKHNSIPDDTRRKDYEELVKNRPGKTQPELQLASYAGRYECDLYGAIEIGFDDDGLNLKFGNNPVAKAIHWEKNSFYVTHPLKENDPSEHWLLHFSVRDGNCHSFRIQQVTQISFEETMPEFERRN